MKAIPNVLENRLGGISSLMSVVIFFCNLPFVKDTTVPLPFSSRQKLLRRDSVSLLYFYLH